MGNREDLLAGARRCLHELGWGRTTVRDICAAAGGVSMAAIGYHFGSREELLTVALVQAMEDLGEQLDTAMATDADGDAQHRYTARWARVAETVRSHRTLWLANLEALARAEHDPRVRERLVAGQRAARSGMAVALPGGAEHTHTAGSAQLALLMGAVLQWLNDPEEAPEPAQLDEGVRHIAALLDPAGTDPRPGAAPNHG